MVDGVIFFFFGNAHSRSGYIGSLNVGSPPVLLVEKSNVTSKTHDLPIIGILCFSQRLENLGFVSENPSLEIYGLKQVINYERYQKSKE